MKKLAIIFSLVFFAFVISASAQSSVSSDKQAPVTEKVKSDDGAKAHGCCAYSTKSCKAGSMKCCSKDKSEAKKSSPESSSKAEAVVTERKAVAEAQRK
jgi:hypothetical protein